MDWYHAQQKIKTRVITGVSLNTASSTYRFVKSMNTIINRPRYGYHNENGLVVTIGQSSTVSIPWGVLEECFEQLNTTDGYSGASFRRRFPLQAKDHPCHVHVIGQILVKAGLARADGSVYRAEDKN